MRQREVREERQREVREERQREVREERPGETHEEAQAGRRVVTVFRSRLRTEHQEEYGQLAARMNELAASMPGFVEIKTYVAEDGERVSVVTFESIETHRAWRDHPDHRAAQAKGRELFYSEYRISVCELLSERTYEA